MSNISITNLTPEVRSAVCADQDSIDPSFSPKNFQLLADTNRDLVWLGRVELGANGVDTTWNLSQDKMFHGGIVSGISSIYDKTYDARDKTFYFDEAYASNRQDLGVSNAQLSNRSLFWVASDGKVTNNTWLKITNITPEDFVITYLNGQPNEDLEVKEIVINTNNLNTSYLAIGLKTNAAGQKIAEIKGSVSGTYHLSYYDGQSIRDITNVLSPCVKTNAPLAYWNITKLGGEYTLLLKVFNQGKFKTARQSVNIGKVSRPTHLENHFVTSTPYHRGEVAFGDQFPTNIVVNMTSLTLNELTLEDLGGTLPSINPIGPILKMTPSMDFDSLGIEHPTMTVRYSREEADAAGMLNASPTLYTITKKGIEALNTTVLYLSELSNGSFTNVNINNHTNWDLLQLTASASHFSLFFVLNSPSAALPAPQINRSVLEYFRLPDVSNDSKVSLNRKVQHDLYYTKDATFDVTGFAALSDLISNRVRCLVGSASGSNRTKVAEFTLQPWNNKTFAVTNQKADGTVDVTNYSAGAFAFARVSLTPGTNVIRVEYDTPDTPADEIEVIYDDSGVKFTRLDYPKVVSPNSDRVQDRFELGVTLNRWGTVQFELFDSLGDVISSEVWSDIISTNVRYRLLDTDHRVLPDGRYEFRMSTVDLLGQVNSGEIHSFRVDTHSPDVRWSPKVLYLNGSGTADLTYEASEPVSIKALVYNSSGECVKHYQVDSKVSFGVLTFYGDDDRFRSLPDGSYLLRLKARDEGGNASLSKSLHLGIKRNPPVLDTFVAVPSVLVSGAMEGGFRFFASEKGKATLELLDMNSNLLQTLYQDEIISAGRVKLTWNGLHDGHKWKTGNYLVRVHMRDIYGNLSASALAKLEIKEDTEAPTITDWDTTPVVLGPHSARVVQTVFSYQLSDNVFDKIGSSLTIVDSDGNKKNKLMPFSDTSNVQLTWFAQDEEGTRLPEGLYYAFVSAWDAVGNSVQSALKKIVIDDTPPEIRKLRVTSRFVSPELENKGTGLNFAVYDRSALTLHQGIYRRGLLIHSFEDQNITSGVVNVFAWDGFTRKRTPAPDGNYDWQFEIEDEAGNRTNFSVTVTVDTIAPQMDIPRMDFSIFSPNNDGRKDWLDIRLSARDNLSERVKAELIFSNLNTNLVPHRQIRTENFSLIRNSNTVFSWDGRDQNGQMLSDGLFSVFLRGWDEAGNEATSFTNLCEIDLTPPQAPQVSIDRREISPNGDGYFDTSSVHIQVSNTEAVSVEHSIEGDSLLYGWKANPSLSYYPETNTTVRVHAYYEQTNDIKAYRTLTLKTKGIRSVNIPFTPRIPLIVSAPVKRYFTRSSQVSLSVKGQQTKVTYPTVNGSWNASVYSTETNENSEAKTKHFVNKNVVGKENKVHTFDFSQSPGYNFVSGTFSESGSPQYSSKEGNGAWDQHYVSGMHFTTDDSTHSITVTFTLDSALVNDTYASVTVKGQWQEYRDRIQKVSSQTEGISATEGWKTVDTIPVPNGAYRNRHVQSFTPTPPSDIVFTHSGWDVRARTTRHVYFPASWSGTSGLYAEYYRGASFNDLMVCKQDAQINFDWGYNAPSWSGTDSYLNQVMLEQKNNFMARWTGYLKVPNDGYYDLKLEGYVGFSLYFNNKLLIHKIENVNYDGNKYYEDLNSALTTVFLKSGKSYPIRIEMENRRNSCPNEFCFSYRKSSYPIFAPIPADWLSTQPNNTLDFSGVTATNLSKSTGTLADYLSIPPDVMHNGNVSISVGANNGVTVRLIKGSPSLSSAKNASSNIRISSLNDLANYSVYAYLPDSEGRGYQRETKVISKNINSITKNLVIGKTYEIGALSQYFSLSELNGLFITGEQLTFKVVDTDVAEFCIGSNGWNNEKTLTLSPGDLKNYFIFAKLKKKKEETYSNCSYSATFKTKKTYVGTNEVNVGLLSNLLSSVPNQVLHNYDEDNLIVIFASNNPLNMKFVNGNSGFAQGQDVFTNTNGNFGSWKVKAKQKYTPGIGFSLLTNEIITTYTAHVGGLTPIRLSNFDSAYADSKLPTNSRWISTGFEIDPSCVKAVRTNTKEPYLTELTLTNTFSQLATQEVGQSNLLIASSAIQSPVLHNVLSIYHYPFAWNPEWIVVKKWNLTLFTNGGNILADGIIFVTNAQTGLASDFRTGRFFVGMSRASSLLFTNFINGVPVDKYELWSADHIWDGKVAANGQTVSDGRVYSRVTVRDVAGNGVTVSTPIEIDTLAPSLSFDLLYDGQVVSDLISIKGSVQDPRLSRYKLWLEQGNIKRTLAEDSSLRDHKVLAQLDTLAVSNGSLKLFLQAEDRLSNVAQLSLNLLVSNTLSSYFSIQSSGSSLIGLGTNFKIEYIRKQNVNLTTRLDGEIPAFSTSSMGNNIYQMSIPTVLQGDHALQLRARVSGQNFDMKRNIYFTVDADNPFAELNVPNQVSGILPIYGSARDTYGIDHYTLDLYYGTQKIQNLLQSGQTVSNGLLASWDTTGIHASDATASAPRYELRLSVWDKTGHTGQTNVFVRVDNAAPIISFTDQDNYLKAADTLPILIQDEFLSNYFVTASAQGSIFKIGNGFAQGAYLRTNLSLPFNTDGIYNISVWAEDSAGNTNIQTRTYIYDATAPQISVEMPSVNRKLQLLIELSDANLQDISLFANEHLIYSNAVTNTRLVFDEGITNDQTGQIGQKIPICVSVRDRAGNESVSNFSLTLDLTAPIIVLTQPLSGQVFRDVLAINAEISDSYFVRSVEWGIDGIAENFITNVSRLSLNQNVNIAFLNEGRHSLVLKVRDMAGNERVETRFFDVDRSAPQVTFYSSTQGFVSEQPIELSADLKDTHPGEWELRAEQSNRSLVLASGKQGLSTEHRYLSVFDENWQGLTHFVLIVRDSAGNETEKSMDFDLDNLSPSVTLQKIDGHNTLGTGTVAGIVNFKWTVSDAHPNNFILTAGNSRQEGMWNDGNLTLNLDTADFADGEVPVQLILKDSLDHASEWNGNIQVDQTPPKGSLTTSLTQYSPTSEKGTILSLNLSVNEPVMLLKLILLATNNGQVTTFDLGYSDIVIQNGKWESQWNGRVNGKLIPNGNYILEAMVRDAVGHVSVLHAPVLDYRDDSLAPQVVWFEMPVKFFHPGIGRGTLNYTVYQEPSDFSKNFNTCAWVASNSILLLQTNNDRINRTLIWDGRDTAGNILADGFYPVFVELRDLVGNRSVLSNEWVLDSESPVISNRQVSIVKISPRSRTKNHSDLSMDVRDGFALAEWNYTIRKGSLESMVTQQISGKQQSLAWIFDQTEEGNYTLHEEVRDKAGNVASTETQIEVDSTAPYLYFNHHGQSFIDVSNRIIVSTNFKMSLESLSEDLSGLYYGISSDKATLGLRSVSNMEWQTFNTLSDGAYWIGTAAVDDVDNWVSNKIKLYVDGTPPVTSVHYESLNGIEPYPFKGNDYISFENHIHISGSDFSGIAECRVRLLSRDGEVATNFDSLQCVLSNQSFTFADFGIQHRGVYDILVESVDSVSNRIVWSNEIRLPLPDFTSPVTRVVLYGSVYTNILGKIFTDTNSEIFLPAEDLKGPLDGYVSGVAFTESRWSTNLPWTKNATNFDLQNEGVYDLQYRSIDNVSNREEIQGFSFAVDGAPPVSILTLTGSVYTNLVGRIYADTNTRIHLIATEGEPLAETMSGVKRIWVAVLSKGVVTTNWNIYNQAILLDYEDDYLVLYRSEDNVGNLEEIRNFELTVDGSPAEIVLSFAGKNGIEPLTWNNQTWISFDHNLKWSGSDALSGIRSAVLNIRSSEHEFSREWSSQTLNGINFNFLSLGIWDRGNVTLSLSVTDRVGNAVTVGTNLNIPLPDTTPPVSALSVSGVFTHEYSEWLVNSNSVFSLSAVDILDSSDQTNIGLAHIEFAVDDEPWQVYDQSLRFAEDGNYRLKFRAVDAWSNVETLHAVQIHVRSKRPDITGLRGIVYNGNKLTYSWEDPDVTNTLYYEFETNNATIFLTQRSMHLTNVSEGTFIARVRARSRYGVAGPKREVTNFLDSHLEIFVPSTNQDIVFNKALPIIGRIRPESRFGRTRNLIRYADIEGSDWTVPTNWHVIWEDHHAHYNRFFNLFVREWKHHGRGQELKDGRYLIQVKTQNGQARMEDARVAQLDQTAPVTGYILGTEFITGSSKVEVLAGTSLSLWAEDSVVNGVSSGVREIRYSLVYLSEREHKRYRKHQDHRNRFPRDFRPWHHFRDFGVYKHPLKLQRGDYLIAIQAVDQSRNGYLRAHRFFRNLYHSNHDERWRKWWQWNKDDGNVSETKYLLVHVADMSDNQAPEIHVTGITPNQWANAPVTIQCEALDRHLSGTRLLVDGVLQDGNQSIVSNEGTHQIFFEAWDRLSNKSQTNLAFHINLEPPIISLSGAEQSYSVTPLHIVVEVSELYPAGMHVLLNGQTVSGKTVDLTNGGFYTLEVYAADLAGNTSRLSRSFTVALDQNDTEPPAVSISGITDNMLSDQPLNIRVVVNEAHPNWSGSAVWLDGVKENFDSSGVWTALVNQDGFHTLRVYTLDQNGFSTELQLSATLDQSVPQITFSGVADGTVTNVPMTITAQVEDLTAVETTFTVDGEVQVGSSVTVTTEGDHTAEISASDALGHQSQKSLNFSIDTTSPEISIFGIENGVLVSNEVEIGVESKDAHLFGQKVLLNGVLVGSLPLQIITEGNYHLDVEAFDTVGNTNRKSLDFAIDLQAPEITVTGVSNGEITNKILHIAVKVSDLSLSEQKILLDGVEQSESITVASDGDHLLVVTAKDAFDRTTCKKTAFLLDTIAPLVQVDGLDLDVYDRPLSFGFSVTDEHLADFTALLNGNTLTRDSYYLNTNGSFDFSLTAIDTAGNTTLVEKHFTVAIPEDNQAPLITLTGIRDSGIYNTAIVQGDVIVEDMFLNTNSIQIWLNGQI